MSSWGGGLLLKQLVPWSGMSLHVTSSISISLSHSAKATKMRAAQKSEVCVSDTEFGVTFKPQ